MIKIDVRWLVYPAYALAVFLVLTGLYSWLTTIGGPDILPALGFFILLRNGFLALVVAGIAALVHKAFPTEKNDEDSTS